MNEKPKPEPNLSNEVQVIRNILMGEHLEKFQKQVEALEKEVSALKKENKLLLQEMKAENGKMDQELAAKLEQAKAELANTDANIRKNYDAQINELKKRLSAYEDKQGGLIASLAAALLEYKDKSGN